jgi:methionyl-tRNA formyltransferase
MRSAFIGTVRSSHAALEQLAGLGAAPSLVVTLPSDRRQRHSDYVNLSELGAAIGAEVVLSSDANSAEVLQALRRHSPEILWVIGWSQILDAELLDVATTGTVGYHPAPLPAYRGRAVIPWTILTRQHETGGTLFWLDEGMDTGDIAVQHRFHLESRENAASLYEKHVQALRAMITELVPEILQGAPPRRPQDHSAATYCARRAPEDSIIDWHQPAEDVDALVRASGGPYPPAFTFRGKNRLYVLETAIGRGRPYIGLPGQVQEVGDTGAAVLCGDGNYVVLNRVSVDGTSTASDLQVLRRHEKLGAELRWCPESAGLSGQL